MSEKRRGRPKKRPKTVAEWEKSDIIPSHLEVIEMLRDVQTKRLRELERLSMNHNMARGQTREQYNLIPGLTSKTDAMDTTINNLKGAISRGDDRAAARLKEIEDGGKAYDSLLNKQAEARENMKEQFRKQREKILNIGKRRTEIQRQVVEQQHALRRASQDYVEALEHRVLLLEQAMPEMKQVNLLMAKVEWTHAKAKELEQENFKFKRALAQKGILEIDT
jgi:chromosome segregation ATPase